MTVPLIGMIDPVLLLPVIGICALLALMAFVGAVRAKRLERVAQRLRALNGTDDKSMEAPKLPVTLSLDKPSMQLPFSKSDPGRSGPLSRIFGNRNLFHRLVQAGLDPKMFFGPFIFLRVLSFGGGALLCLAGQQVFPGLTPESWMAAILVLVSAVGAGFIPDFLLRYRISSRQKNIERAVPDMIDLLILCVDAGLTLEVALSRAVEGLAPFTPELAAEMKLTLNELRILPDKSMALTNLEQRTGSQSLKYLVLALRQSERYGTSIRDALAAVARENRKHAILTLENNAARMPALLSVPLIALILPPVIAISAGPGFVLMMRTIGE
ncbi:type II secretion system F family protein [Sneathiella sp.]|uniref:type II secretion system F family protein n=1 Tax=Sneathiella sp. TaxID=1964365 RepID=UPI0035662AE9